MSDRSRKIEDVQRTIQFLKEELVQKAQQLRALYRRLDELRKEAGVEQTDEDLLAEYMRVRQRFVELSSDPTKTNQFGMLGLSQKLQRLEEELDRRAKEV